MQQQVVAPNWTVREDQARESTLRRVLLQLFEIESATIDETWTLADFEGCSLPNVAEPLTPMGWRIRVRDRVFAYFGVACDVDEPLSNLVARIEMAERGVRCTLGH